MTYAHVYKGSRNDTFAEELSGLRRKLEGYEQQLAAAMAITSAPAAIASLQGKVDAYATMIHAIEMMSVC